MPSAAELRKMQENELRKQKLEAKKRHERHSPAARAKARRERVLRDKRLAALKAKREMALEARRRALLEAQWKKEWEQKHKDQVTVDFAKNTKQIAEVTLNVKHRGNRITPLKEEKKGG